MSWIRKSDAVVLRRHAYSNSSLILTYFTRNDGQVAVIAKGVRRPRKKGRFDRGPDLFCAGELVYYPRRVDGLGIQSEWSETHDHPHLRGALPAIRAALRVSEVLSVFTRDCGPHPALFDATRACLAGLDAAADAAPDRIDLLGLIVLHFDLKVLRAAGFALPLEQCDRCDAALSGRWLGFVPASNALLCGRCHGEHRERVGRLPVLAVLPEAVSVARRLEQSRLDALVRLRVSNAAHRDLRALLDAAMTACAEREFRCFRSTLRRRRNLVRGSA